MDTIKSLDVKINASEEVACFIWPVLPFTTTKGGTAELKTTLSTGQAIETFVEKECSFSAMLDREYSEKMIVRFILSMDAEG